MSLFDTNFNFNSLSLKDLVEARDIFHVHLINKNNVLATAIGRYRIRHEDPWPGEERYYEQKAIDKTNPQKAERTLANSEVREYSWPCILVFVSNWQTQEELLRSDSLVPKNIYMPDGRIVPICVVKAPTAEQVDDSVDTDKIVFPGSYVGGGFPILIESQGEERIASLGCIVTDGNKYYGLTNKHVTGDAGTPIYTRMRGQTVKIGTGSGIDLGKINFVDAYDGWTGRNIVVNADFGLIEIDDISEWKTDVLGIGEIDDLASLDTSNMTLSLISAIDNKDKPAYPTVKAFGAVSGRIDAEIVGLFYRYKAVGGIEYVADFLFGGIDGKPLNIHHGDSGTLWMIHTDNGKNMPIALHWGQHNIVDTGAKEVYPYALATNLTTACTRLDVDVVRGWNIGNDYTWGKTGHFKIAAKSCELVTDPDLKTLLMANQKNIGYVDDDLIEDTEIVSGKYVEARDKFVPLADVADIIWRTTRPKDETNHFADLDESINSVEQGKTLLELSLEDDANIDIDFWIAHFEALDAVKPNFKKDKHGVERPYPREGALPFRVWQMYKQMIESLRNNGNVDEFICAGGTMAHYVGDACQTLHISYLHHGRPGQSETGVHTAYEEAMLHNNREDLFNLVNQAAKKVKDSDLIDGQGKSAAKRVIDLMKFTIDNLSPTDVCDSYTDNNHSTAKMWDELHERTVVNIAEGCRVMAALWQSAWIAGNGAAIANSELVERDQDTLKDLYNDKKFVESFRMKDPKYKEALGEAGVPANA